MNKIINNRYEIIKKIGSGGMAEVYLANDRVLNREVAVKVLRGDLSSDPVSLLRFQREANAGSGLNHPNVVEIYDVGQDDGSQYIVMEYIEGVTAKELVHRRGALDKEEAVDFMFQLAHGVSKAHSEGIVHRDIKPQNILVKGDGTLKITDFGIAQAGDALQLTKTDSVIGSIHYLAPECVRGEGASVQSDIYAMGIMFYEILTGELPFTGEMPVEIAMKQLRDPVPSVQKFNPGIPNSIVNIINKATSKSTKNRYKRVEEMIDDLTTCLEPKRANELLWIPQNDTNDNTKMIQTLNGLESDVAEKTTPKEPKNKKNKGFLIGGSLVAAILAVVLLFVFINNNRGLLMMDLSGKTLQEARESLAQHNIYISNNIEYEFSDDFAKNQIISTLPEKGEKVEKGSLIRVKLSKGPYFEVLDYSGKNIAEVKELIETETRLFLKVLYESSRTLSKGTIIRQEGIEPGTKIDPDVVQEFILVVASEPEIQVPNLINVDVFKAQKELEKQGFKVEVNPLSMSGMSAEQASGLRFGVVIEMDPIPGSYYIQRENNYITLSYYDEDDKPVDITPEVPDGNEGE